MAAEFSQRITLCHSCEHGNRDGRCNGPCPCTIDGRNIIDHARSGDCPKGYYTGTPQPAPPWPAWATAIQNRRKPGEVGVGDTLARIFSRFGGNAFKRALKRFGVKCGCGARQEAMNAKYPYGSE